MKTNTLKQKIASIRRACNRALTLTNKACAGKWKTCGANKGRCSCATVFGANGEGYVCSMTTVEQADPACDKETRINNAIFIAHSRQFTPAAASMTLVALTALEELVKAPLAYDRVTAKNAINEMYALLKS